MVFSPNFVSSGAIPAGVIRSRVRTNRDTSVRDSSDKMYFSPFRPTICAFTAQRKVSVKILFPKLNQPGTVTGQHAGISVVLCATHDTGSAVEGIPMVKNAPYISSGTWSLLGVKTSKPITDEASRAANYSNEGDVGYNRYQKNIMGMWLVNELQRELCNGLGFAKIVNAAKESACDVLIEANAPEFLAPKSMKAAFDEAAGELNLHASYAIFEDSQWADRDKLEPRHFQKWVDFCKERGLGCDFNPTFFSHPKAKDLTLSSPDPETRRFWIDHGKACIRISSFLAEELGQPCVMNIWTGDGFKDIPADRMGPRVRYKEAIDEILSEPYNFDMVKPCIESKVFGIGVEAYTVGSAEFALSYAAMNRDKCIPLMDNGHYHPTEVVSDKIPALLAFFPEIALHITRPIRWDSDHVVLLDDETKEIAKEIVRCGGLEGRVNISLDYFDASINRISAWIVGFRNIQKALLMALCTPNLTSMQDAGNWTKLMVVQEELKTMPFGEIWNEYCRNCGTPADGEWFQDVTAYEADVLNRRG